MDGIKKQNCLVEITIQINNANATYSVSRIVRLGPLIDHEARAESTGAHDF
jgi:hypothetical protein